jgi:hypothetical protein
MNIEFPRLEPKHSNCPLCAAIEAMTEKEIDERIQLMTYGKHPPPLPEPYPECIECRIAEAMTDDELVMDLERLIGVLRGCKTQRNEADR